MERGTLEHERHLANHCMPRVPASLLSTLHTVASAVLTGFNNPKGTTNICRLTMATVMATVKISLR